jgi:beta-lactamase regulating signal transducer with metallopeptidase domain
MLFKIIQIILFQGVFILLYNLWLQKETFYTANRFYLLLTSFISILLPFIPFQISNNTVIGNQITALSEVMFITDTVQQLPEIILNAKVVNDPYSVLSIIYYIGISLALTIFLWKLFKLIQLIYANKKYPKQNFTIVSLKEQQKVFSFLNYVFIGEKDLAKQADYLLLHEQIHIQHKHTWDLLWFEFLKIIMWFNPFVYLYQKHITALHEFVADAESLKISDKKTYYNHLLNDIFQVENIAFVNQFYTKSLIKKRITMMTKNQSQRWRKVKYLLIIPLITLMVFSCSKVIDNKIETEKVTKNIPFSIVDKIPVYPGCEGIDDKEEQKHCLSKSIQMHVAKEFNVELAQTLGLKPGKKRIFTIFTINKDGTITDVKARAPHKDLEAEAVRVVKTIPKMQPGKSNGEYVGVRYSLPITFVVE